MLKKHIQRVLSRLLSGLKTIFYKTQHSNDNVMEQQQEKNILEIVLCEHTVESHKLKRSFVVPGHITVARGEKVTWRAGKTKIVMFFPNERLFNTEKIIIEAGEEKTETVNEKVEPGEYPYAVYTEGINDFAEGGSSPRMSIK